MLFGATDQLELAPQNTHMGVPRSWDPMCVLQTPIWEYLSLRGVLSLYPTPI